MTAVTGHVYVMYDNDLKPQAKGGLPIVCVSVPGVNLQKSTDDGKHFTNVIPITNQVILKQDTKKELVYRIRRILHHAFLRFQTFGCQVPVLCAIGCGVFASRIAEVPSLYAAAMAHLLSKHNYNFRAVVIPLMTPSDYKDFRNAFKNAPIPHCPVLLMLSRSMIHIADRLARNNICAGILNPSDPLAVRAGYLGMYFERDPVSPDRQGARRRQWPHRRGGARGAANHTPLASQGLQPRTVHERRRSLRPSGDT